MIELIYFDGCPNADAARENLRAALTAAGLAVAWQEWNQSDPMAPDHVKCYGSPSVLVNGRDVKGQEPGDVALSCRADGVPSPESIRAALEG